MSDIAVFNVPVLGIAFFAGKQKNSKGEDVAGFTGSYNGKTKEYKLTQVVNVEFKDALKNVQKATDYWSKLASDNGGVLSGIHFDEGSLILEILISDLSAEGASNTTSGVTADCSAGTWLNSGGC